MTTPSICIVQPSLGKASETFIAAHAERLPADVTVVHGLRSRGEWPQINGTPILSQSPYDRAVRKLKRLVQGKPWDWEYSAAYLQAFRQTKARAVLAEYGMSATEVLEACRYANLPLIVHFHGHDVSRKSIVESYRSEYIQLFQKAAAIIAVSTAMESALVGLGAPRDKVFRNTYGVDCTLFQPTNPAVNPPTFVSTGRFVEKKAPYLTLLAFRNVLDVCSDAKLRMIGDGVLLGPCRDIAKSLSIDHAVEFLGTQPHQVVAAEMKQARAFVQHSVEASDGDCEGTPNSVLEAGASGLPVIATNHAGIPDVVVDEITGLLVDERDVAGMSNHMIRIAQDTILAARLGAAGRDRIEQHFSMDRSIARLWEIIESCIERRAPQLGNLSHQPRVPSLIT